jgi:hypothetical protein
MRNPPNIKGDAEKKIESLKGCKHPLIASGATTIGSAWRAPDKLAQEYYSWEDGKTIYLSLYPKNFRL